jgi:hypothetical protein
MVLIVYISSSLVEAPLAAITAGNNWVIFYQRCANILYPLFLTNLLKLNKFGWTSLMDSNIQTFKEKFSKTYILFRYLFH